MTVSSFGASFEVEDTVGRLRADLGIRDKENAATASFYDEKGIGRAAIGHGADGPAVLLLDASGKPFWTAPNNTNSAAVPGMAGAGRHPRVFIETWAVTQFLKPQREESFAEMPVFMQRCPQAAATINQQEGDYILRLEHHYMSPGNGFYQYATFDGKGAAIGAGSNLQLWEAADSACKGILTDWAAKGR
jgi:hypothetical protein